MTVESEPRKHREVTIFAIDDDDVDYLAIQRSMKKARIANDIVRAKDGQEAVDMLRAGQVASPYVILLDLNMPRMNGFEFLDEIRNDASLKTSLIFVLTTSADERDIYRAYDKFVAGYIVKQDVMSDFENLVNTMDNYWRIIELPPQL